MFFIYIERERESEREREREIMNKGKSRNAVALRVVKKSYHCCSRIRHDSLMTLKYTLAAPG